VHRLNLHIIIFVTMLMVGNNILHIDMNNFILLFIKPNYILLMIVTDQTAMCSE